MRVQPVTAVKPPAKVSLNAARATVDVALVTVHGGGRIVERPNEHADDGDRRRDREQPFRHAAMIAARLARADVFDCPPQAAQ